ncbi:MAG TPA: c-type cytochrome [Candidatus Acidoferrales bacterium]|jgi:putative heme-binding domain-containing protein|nr:c-type cytochrome [Candidatus Acidoferrales bacterium]
MEIQKLRPLRFLVSSALIAFVLLPAAQALRAQNPPTQYAPADIEYGARIFLTQCTGCHGVNGDQVPGVNLGSGQFRHVFSDSDLRSVITNGIPGTGMRPFNFDPSELAGIVAYIRNMHIFDAGKTKLGDPTRGEALFEGTGNCGSCHRVNGKGPRVAPDLSDIGALRTADLLERSLVDPSAAMLPMNRSVRAVLRNGKVITGRRLNEDTYSVQLIDDQEHLVSLDKSDLREYTVVTTSSMPSYKDKLSAQEISDVVAYLLTLKGVK